MKASVGIVFVVALLLVVAIDTEAAISSGDDQLLPACKTVGGGSTFFDVEFCVSALGSDNRSHTAESYRDFADIAVDLLTANATRTAARINGLNRAGGGKDKAMTQCLESCQALYEDVLHRQLACATAVKDGEFGEAAASLEKSAAAAEECEGGFGKSKVASPVTMEDDSAFKLAKLAVALLRFA